MLSYKGVVDAVIFFAVIAFAFSIILLVIYIGPKTHAIEIQKRVDLFMENEDRGTGIISLLKTKKSNITYAEILGDNKALTKPENIDRELKNTLKLTDPELKLIVIDNEKKIVSKYGIDSEDLQGFLFVDLALPGGMKGEVGIK